MNWFNRLKVDHEATAPPLVELDEEIREIELIINAQYPLDHWPNADRQLPQLERNVLLEPGFLAKLLGSGVSLSPESVKSFEPAPTVWSGPNEQSSAIDG